MTELKITTWNVNSINSRTHNLSSWLKQSQPDILCLQELKCVNESLPYDLFDEMGYNYAVNGQKTYNGVAILSKIPIDEIIYDFPDNPDQSQKRFIEISVSYYKKSIRIISLYVPNGADLTSDKFEYKLKFLQAFKCYAKKLLDNQEIVVLAGDFNIAPFEIDVYSAKDLENSICFSSEERKMMHEILNLGYIDSFRTLNPEKRLYSWWDYRAGAWQNNKGMRIDHLLCSPEAADYLTDVQFDLEERDKNKPSDHIPVNAIFNIQEKL